MLAAAVAANATIVTNYYDDFSGSSGSVLNGTAPDITVGTNTWTANSILKADGSGTNNTVNFSAYVPLTIVAGQAYTLTMDVTLLAASAGTRNVALGFGNANSITSVSWTANTRNAAAVALTYAGNVNTYANGAASGLSAYAGGSTYTNAALKIVLSTYADATPWTAEYFHDNISMGSATITNGSAIDRVGFSGGLDSILVDNFKLTTVVPEPATIGMLGLGTLFVYFVRRARR